jgi:hypothetical protein
MTAEPRGPGQGTLFPLLKRLREQWMLVVALLTALFWVVTQIEVYRHLPEKVAAQAEVLDVLDHRVLKLETRMDGEDACRRIRGRQLRPRPAGGPVGEKDCASSD